MPRFTVILLIVVLLEAIACGTVMVRKMFRVEPLLPPVHWDDPLLEKELSGVAERARTGNSKAWQTWGEALLGQGFYHYSEIAFRQALKLDPRNHEARFGLAFCLDHMGRMEESVHEYGQLAALRTRGEIFEKLGTDSQYALGCNLLREEKAAEAEQAFRQIADDPRAKYQIAKLQIRSGQAEKAQVDDLPFSQESLFLQYRAALALNRNAEAIQAADQLERATKRILLHFNTDYVRPFYAQYGLERIIQDYNQLIFSKNMDRLRETLDKIFVQVRHLRSPYAKLALQSMLDVELQRKNAEQLRNLVQQLRDFGEMDADMLQFEGAAAAEDGNLQQAATLWQRANAMSPNIQLSLKLAEYYESQHNTRERDKALAESLLLGALGQYRQNKLEPAHELLKKSLDSSSSNPRTWFYLGETLRVLGAREKALEAYQQCLNLNSNDGRAITRLRQMKLKSL